MSNQTPIQPILKGIQHGSKPEENELFRLLFKLRTHFLKEENVKLEEIEDVFADAFYVLRERIRLGKVRVSIEGKNEEQHNWLYKIFESILLKQILQIEKNAWSVVEGVRRGNAVAKEALSNALNKDSFIGYAQKLTAQFHIKEIAAEDFVNEALLMLFEKIDQEKFVLQSNEPNELNKNRLFKFFRDTIYNKIRKWNQNQQELIAMDSMIENIDHESQEPDFVSDEEGTQYLRWKLFELMNQQGEPCRSVLRHIFYHQHTPGQTARLLNLPELPDADAVESQKVQCLNNLHKNFMQWVSTSNTRTIAQIETMSRTIVSQLQEPCKTILRYALPPAEMGMEGILQVLQKSLPAADLNHLTTAEQVKRRKYKCLQTLHNNFWVQLINFKNN